jgi:hypothetical protein
MVIITSIMQQQDMLDQQGIQKRFPDRMEE